MFFISLILFRTKNDIKIKEERFCIMSIGVRI